MLTACSRSFSSGVIQSPSCSTNPFSLCSFLKVSSISSSGPGAPSLCTFSASQPFSISNRSSSDSFSTLSMSFLENVTAAPILILISTKSSLSLVITPETLLPFFRWMVSAKTDEPHISNANNMQIIPKTLFFIISL